MRTAATLFIALLVGMLLLSTVSVGLAEGEEKVILDDQEAVAEDGEASSSEAPSEAVAEDGEASSAEAPSEAGAAEDAPKEKVAEPLVVDKFVAASETGLRTPEVKRPGVTKATAVGTSRFKRRSKSGATRILRRTVGRKQEHRIMSTNYERDEKKKRWTCTIEYEYWDK